jgi:DNA-binding response OmpR family regulator
MNIMIEGKILIVEDEAELADILELYLQKWNYEVCGKVTTGEAAIEAAVDTKPDLILMDINLEGKMTGMDAAEHVRYKYGIPSIYITAYSDEVIFQRAKTTEPYGYIVKPINPRELQIAIELALYREVEEKEKNELLDELAKVKEEEQY